MNPWKISTIGLGAWALAVTVALPVASADRDNVSQEKQPHMKAALNHLDKADAALKDAKPDKDGHREKAIKLVHDAIEETKAGIAAGEK